MRKTLVKGRPLLIILMGFWAHEVFEHVWLGFSGLLPFTSRLFGFTLTPEVNTMLLTIDTIVFLLIADLAFVGPIHRRIRHRRVNPKNVLHR